MTAALRFVFDCSVLFQALISPTGPARRLLRTVSEGRTELFLSAYVLEELKELADDPTVRRKYRLTEEEVDEFSAVLRRHGTFIETVPHVFEYERDPDDAHYVDLAVAAKASLIVSRDKDLLELRDETTETGRTFVVRFPELLVLTPPEALALIEREQKEE